MCKIEWAAHLALADLKPQWNDAAPDELEGTL